MTNDAHSKQCPHCSTNNSTPDLPFPDRYQQLQEEKLMKKRQVQEEKLKEERGRRQDLLKTASAKPLRTLWQIDGWSVPGGDDSVKGTDDDGDCILQTMTDEFRTSDETVAVRVHIHPQVDKKTVERLLQKIANRPLQYIGEPLAVDSCKDLLDPDAGERTDRGQPVNNPKYRKRMIAKSGGIKIVGNKMFFDVMCSACEKDFTLGVFRAEYERHPHHFLCEDCLHSLNPALWKMYWTAIDEWIQAREALEKNGS